MYGLAVMKKKIEYFWETFEIFFFNFLWAKKNLKNKLFDISFKIFL